MTRSDSYDIKLRLNYILISYSNAICFEEVSGFRSFTPGAPNLMQFTIKSRYVGQGLHSTTAGALEQSLRVLFPNSLTSLLQVECWVKKSCVEIEIMSKCPSNICAATHQDDYACNACFSCGNNRICCNQCICCNSRHEEIIENKWSSYIHDHFDVFSCRETDIRQI